MKQYLIITLALASTVAAEEHFGRPQLRAEQIQLQKSIHVTVEDPARTNDFVYVTVRGTYYDPDKLSHFRDSGTQYKLAKGDTNLFEGVIALHQEGLVHGSTAQVEYTYDQYPDSRNYEHTRTTVEEVTFAYH